VGSVDYLEAKSDPDDFNRYEAGYDNILIIFLVKTVIIRRKVSLSRPKSGKVARLIILDRNLDSPIFSLNNIQINCSLF
jgi:hypothetical protein